MLARALLVSLALLSAATSTACHFFVGLAPCDAATPCDSGQCVRGFCAGECTLDGPACPGTTTCVDGACVDAAEGEGDEGEGEGAEGEGGEGEGGEGEGEGGEGEGEGGEGEGEGDGGEGEACIDVDGDLAGTGACEAVDCDDGDARKRVGRAEECDGLDNDCDGVVDNGDLCGCVALRFGDGKDPRQLCLRPRTYADAELACRSNGYRLAIFADRAESEQVVAAIGQIDTRFTVWIGLDDRANDGSFVWLDGTPQSIAAGDFLLGEPSGGGEDCIEIKDGSGWNDNDCATFEPFLCEPAPEPPTPGPCAIDVDGDLHGEGCALGPDCDDGDADVFALVGGVQDFDGDGATSAIREVACTDGSLAADFAVSPSGTDCDDTDEARTQGCANDCVTVGPTPTFLCTDGATFAEANNTLCTGRFSGARLVSIHDQQRADLVAQLVLGNFEDRVWIGLTDALTEGVQRWTDGQTLNNGEFEAFSPGEPNNFNNSEDCVGFEKGSWNDTSCNQNLSFVCE